MGTGTRQWKALMRKNFIAWKRQPKCSFFEICCPAAVMFLMVILRNVVEVETFDFSVLAKVRSPSALGLEWNPPSDTYPKGVWSYDDYFSEVQSPLEANLEDFFKYGSYPLPPYYSVEALAYGTPSYNFTTDPTSPLAFIPSQCLKKESFQLPRVSMPVIAVVGEENQAQYMMQNYLEVLLQWQAANVDLIEMVANATYGTTELTKFVFMNFKDKAELFEYTSADNYTFNGGLEGVCYGFQFDYDEDTKEANLELFFNDQQQMGGPNSIGIPNTLNAAYDPLSTTPNTAGFVDYLTRGYGLLQNLGANIVLKLETEDEKASIAYLTAPMPASSNTSDPFLQIWTLTLPFLLLLIFIPPVYNTVFLIVREKESRIKESMRMMGMKDSAYWLSWYCYYSCISFMICLLAWCVLLINCIEHSNIFLVFVFFLFYAQAVFAEITFLASLFENSKFSGLVGTLIYFGFQLIGIAVQQPDSPAAAKIFLSIIPQVAMQQTSAVFGNLEGSGVGLHFDNMTETIGNYSFLTGLIMFIVSFAFWMLLGFYMDAVLPRTYGERQKACFCFTMCCRNRDQQQVQEEQFSPQEQQRRSTLSKKNGAGEIAADPFELKYLDPENYEPVAPEIARMELENQYLKIQDLTKVYPNGFQAVNGINLKMYNGQIFALLGHNGAGKSTTISMLTGLLAKSTGGGRIFDNDLFGEMDQVRQYMGVCPQHDVLFDSLTPEEHLDIFYDFKGGNPATKTEEVQGLITDVGVAPDKKKMAGSLSGGNRRKLSVAIALCGNSRLVLLDEPTAGMDLSARRGLWDMLKNYRNNRIIILTTHYMDEADVLGDRIGIMGKGKVLCLGTSLFLKNRYGAGYKLTMVKKFKKSNKKIQPYLESIFGKVEKLSEVSQEITFKIDYDQAAQFQNFFGSFDDALDSLDILSYGISMTTLEEVFLKANGDIPDGAPKADVLDDQDKEFKQVVPGSRRDSSLNGEEGKIEEENKLVKDEYSPEQENESGALSSENLVGAGTLWSSIKALLIKRFNIYKRDKCGLVCELVVPCILVIFGLSLLQVSWLKNPPQFQLTTDAYPGPQRMLMNSDNIVHSDNEFTPLNLAQSLPSYPDYWDVTYEPASSYDDYTEFYTLVNQTQFNGDPQPYRFGTYQIYKADSESNNYQVNVFVNATSTESVPYFQQYMYESILTNVNKDITFNVFTTPFPIFYVFESRVASGQSIDFAVISAIALALIPCVIISFIIKEREMQLKHMQLISGVSLPAYWLSNIISDIVKTYIPIFIILILTLCFDLQYEGVWQIFMLYPIVIVPFTYITAAFFQSDTVAQICTLFMHFLIGGIMPVVIFVLQNIPNTADLGDSMRWWFTPIPTFCVGQGIVFSSTYELLNIARNGLIEQNFDVQPVNTDVYALTNLGGIYIIMICTAIVCFILLAVMEADIFQSCSKLTVQAIPPPKGDLDLDDDVLAEEERLMKQTISAKQGGENEKELLLDQEAQQKNPDLQDVIRVSNFRKAYTSLFGAPFLAVERISFGLDYGECFALLGVNGAGKSTTFKSLTRDIVPTAGEISIAGFNVLSEFDQARRMIGYCPQHDAIFPLMTVEEHIWFYAKIKGIPENLRAGVVEDCIIQLNLADHRVKCAGTLSGGNKRKLSVAIAIVGNPPIILLDEPSAGMDPEARRFMWSVVEKISQRDKKSAVILTTHSMEEAEALSTKMGIMVRGGIFRCFGSSQHIKNKFATGYELEIKIRKSTFQELEQLKTHYGLVGELSSRINLEDAKATLENTDIEGLVIDQLRIDGVGSDLFIEASVNNGTIRMSALLQFCFVQQNGFKFINEMCKVFEQVELLEQVGDFYKIRTPREDKTIGYLFGQIESRKQELNICEYGVAQTSLEQIFQNFALQSIDAKAAFTFKINALDQLQLMNPDRKSTMLQKRMSLTGRKSEGGSRLIE